MAISAVKKGGARDGHPMLSGILIGLVLGVGISAAVAVWVARMPNPFQNRALEGAPAAPAVLAPPPPPAAASSAANAAAGGGPASAPARSPAPAAATGAGAGDAVGSAAVGSDGAGGGAAGDSAAGGATGNGATPGPAAATGGGKALDSGSATLQVGAFANEEDALRQVETIAQVTGARAKVLPPEKSDHPLYRVRIGPVQRGTELSDLVDALKANGISSTVVRAAGAVPSP